MNEDFGDRIVGIWDDSRYGWYLHNGGPVVGEIETIRVFLEEHPPADPRALRVKPFPLEDRNGGPGFTTTTITQGGFRLGGVPPV